MYSKYIFRFITSVNQHLLFFAKSKKTRFIVGKIKQVKILSFYFKSIKQFVPQKFETVAKLLS